MKGKIYLLCVFLLAAAGSISAQTGHIIGNVSMPSGKAMKGLHIRLDNTDRVATTDEMGTFSFNNVPAKEYILLVEEEGYEEQITSVFVEENKTQDVTIQLEEKDANSIGDVVIYGKYYNRYNVSDVSKSLRLNTPLLEIPQNIEVITSAALIDQQALNLNDGVIRNVSGMTKLEHWGELYTRVNMRGARAAAFMNGVNITSNWGPLSEDMSYVDRIEVVKGPAGFMMANGDPSGFYNIVTKKPTGKDLNGYARATTGSYDLIRADLDVDGKINDKLSARINLMGQNKNSFRKYEFNNRYIIAPSLRYDLDKNTSLTLEYIYQFVKMSEVGSAYIFSTEGYKTFPRTFTFSDPGIAPTRINDHTFNFNLQHYFNDQWKFTAQLMYLNNYLNGSSTWPSAVNPDGTVKRNVGIWEALNEQKFAQMFVNGELNTGSIAHHILAGVDIGIKKYMADWNQSHDLDTDSALFDPRKNTYQAPANGYPAFDYNTPLEQRANPSGTIDQRYAALYLQDVLGFWNDRIRLTLAGRFTSVSQASYGGADQKADRFTPRIGLSASIDRNTAAYALFDQAFVPQAGFIRDGSTVRPITGSLAEVGIKREWAQGRWHSSLSVYRIEKNNQLTADPYNAPNEQYSVVMGQSVAQGIDLDIKGEIFNGLELIFNYAYADNEITESNVETIKVGDRIAGFAKHTSNAWLKYTVQHGALKGVGITGGFTLMNDRSTWAWAKTSTQIDMDDYFKLDAGLFWENNKFRATLNVFNVLDAYLYSGTPYSTYYYYQAEAPRNWRLSVGYKF